MAQDRSLDYEEKIRHLLAAVRDGDPDAFAALIEEVGQELRKLSAYWRRRQFREAHTLQTTALVNEVVLRLLRSLKRSKEAFPQSRLHFISLAAQMMRWTLVDYARKPREQPLDDPTATLIGWSRIELDTVLIFDQALRRLEEAQGEIGKRRARAVELHVLGGMTHREIAEQLCISDDAARRDCQIGLTQIREALRGKAQSAGR
ncbi:MAG: sigma-70 family RNA polymerase sigma factor [Candidatus Hydrogenedentes bacterium]|nr:sigma-70 family RNA polymerase sigma factor [Candidatus Hydrogenedentota bacterium]